MSLVLPTIAAAAPDRLVHSVNLALIHRGEDAVNDLFSRAGFGTEPVQIERDTGRAIVLAMCQGVTETTLLSKCCAQSAAHE